jgi:predicted nucleic acid-binding protein
LTVILVDTSVLLDIFAEDATWADWSLAALEQAAARDDLVINDVIYAELSTRYATIEALDAAIAGMVLRHASLPRKSLFLAGKAFRLCRERRGAKTGVLADFFIGAHAACEGWPLLTRDTRRIASYFPTVQLIAPKA